MKNTRNRYTDNDLKDNYNYVKNIIGQVPLYKEFDENTKISIVTYATRLGLKKKVYDEIIKYYSNEDEYNDYIKRKKEHKTKVGKITGSMSQIYSDDLMETNFRYIFDKYMFKYDRYPSRRLFDNISPFDSRHYRKRYNKSWTDICKSYGYDIRKQNKNIDETICLGMCAELFNKDYISQKTWSWLIGVGGKNMFCDGYFENLNLVIEFDGKAHRVAISKFGGEENLIRTQENDNLKEKLLSEHGIKIIRIDSRLQWYTKNGLVKIIQDECEKRGYNYYDFFILSDNK